MKKFLISLNLIILSYFFTTNLICCGEEFFLDSDFNVNNIQNSANQGFNELEKKIQENYDALQKRLDDAKSKSEEKKLTPIQNKKEEIKQETKEEIPPIKEEKEGFFSKLFKKKKKDEPQRGYYGTLPDISKDFKYEKPTGPTVRNNEYKIPTLDELNSEIDKEKLKQAPIQDALFLDNILKKEDTTSEYLKDIHKIKFALSNLKKCIEENGDIQRFNACVNMIDLQSANFEEKYKNKSDALKESYKDILSVNYHSKVLGNLLYDSNYYSRYIPTSQGKYSKDNIDSEKQKLLIKLNKTIFLINQES